MSGHSVADATALVAVQPAVQSAAHPALNPLIGGWNLLRWEIAYEDGRAPSTPFGADATGILVYAPDGCMNASISRARRKPLSSPSTRTAPVEERLAAFESFFSYGGRYRIESGADGQHVVHSVSQSLNPNFIGSEQRRKMDFAADGTLTLSAADGAPGSGLQRHHRLIWKRAQ